METDEELASQYSESSRSLESKNYGDNGPRNRVQSKEDRDKFSEDFYSDSSQPLELKKMGDNGPRNRVKKEKTITRTDVIFKELVADPIRGTRHALMSHHRFAPCEYAGVLPLILSAIGGFLYLIGYLYEKLFFDMLSTRYYYILLFEGWTLTMCFLSLTLFVKLCQVGLNGFCCRRKACSRT